MNSKMMTKAVHDKYTSVSTILSIMHNRKHQKLIHFIYYFVHKGVLGFWGFGEIGRAHV